MLHSLISRITGTDYAQAEITDGAGRRFTLNPSDRVHRAIAQAMEEKEIRDHFPHLVGMLQPDWKIKINQ